MFTLRTLVATAAVVVTTGVAAGHLVEQSAHAAASTELVADPGSAARRMGNQRAVAAPPPPPPSTTVPPATDVAATVVALTNAERAVAGLAPVSAQAQLTSAALTHSQDQAAMRRMTHTGSNGSSAGDRIEQAGYRWRTWAENVAVGYRSAEAVMDGWMNSSGHRANILNADMVHIGVAVVTGSDGRTYWTMVLAA